MGSNGSYPVRRCCAASMWNATSDSCEPPASVSRTRSWSAASRPNIIRDLRRGLPSPRAPGTGLAAHPGGMNNHPLPETNPSTTHLQRKERTGNANPTSACGSWRPQRIDAPRRPRKRRRGRTHTRRHRSRRRARCRTRALRRTARRP